MIAGDMDARSGLAVFHAEIEIAALVAEAGQLAVYALVSGAQFLKIMQFLAAGLRQAVQVRRGFHFERELDGKIRGRKAGLSITKNP